MLAFSAVVLTPRAALGAPIDAKARQGIALAQKGNCEKAVPILEDVELERHRPSTAVALAGCYQTGGELVRAFELYSATSQEKPARGWSRDDHNAKAKARRKAAELDVVIPQIKFKVAEDYEDLELEIDGRPVTDLNEPRRFVPDTQITISARAAGREEIEEKLTLLEGERRVFVITLKKADPKAAPKSKAKKPSDGDGEAPGSTSYALGARFRGMIIPKFLMNAFGEGGTTVFAPGGDVTFTVMLADVDVQIGVGYSSYRMGEVPFKPNGRPDTEYEILQSDMQALLATVDLLWTIGLDKHKRWSLRIGGGVGVGWTFAGDLYRTQAYPPTGVAGDPYQYVKCGGPNVPDGKFRYCNQLDKDATHYGGYTEPSWFDGGVRPLVFPWLTIPQIGLSWRIARRTSIDLDAGLTLSGFSTSAGVRFEL